MIKKTKSLARTVKRLERCLRGRDIWISRDLNCPYRIVGSEYGGWGINLQCLKSTSIIYSAGIGTDTSFDQALIRSLGAKVFAFDPTEHSCRWLSKQSLSEKFYHSAVGLADFDGHAVFELPPSGHVSFQYRSQSDTADGVKLPVKRLSTIMGELDHDYIDLLKMDVEGAEYGIIADMLASQLNVRQLLVEFHYEYGNKEELTRLRNTLKELRDGGFRVFWLSNTGREMGLIQSNAVTR